MDYHIQADTTLFSLVDEFSISWGVKRVQGPQNEYLTM